MGIRRIEDSADWGLGDLGSSGSGLKPSLHLKPKALQTSCPSEPSSYALLKLLAFCRGVLVVLAGVCKDDPGTGLVNIS